MKQFKIKVQVLYLYFFFCNIYIRQQNKIRITESQLKRVINEAVSQILEYNDGWLKKVGDCDFLSDEDKKAIQIASMNKWDKHEREEKKKQDMDKLEKLSNKNIY